MTADYFLGVDGGGTGCRARLEDADGRALGQGLSGPATTRLGVPAAWASVLRAVDAAYDEAGLDSAARARTRLGVALAGIGRKGALAELEAIAQGFAATVFTSDAMGACIGAHTGRDGAIVIAGTGSVGIGMVAGRMLRVGGYGFPVSDEGSGADLGLRAVQLALRARDGRIELSALMYEVMARFHDDPVEVVAWMDAATASDYATFAPMVMRHADQGDPMARRIVQAGAEQIDVIVRHLFDQGAPRVSLLGGLASPLEPWLAPDVRRRLRPPDGDGVAGALVLARGGVTPGDR